MRILLAVLLVGILVVIALAVVVLYGIVRCAEAQDELTERSGPETIKDDSAQTARDLKSRP
jgi:cell division septation protein DedD